MAPQSRTVLVTGASGGIGSATVDRLDRLGWRVFAGVRTTEAGDRLAGGRERVVPVMLDIADEASISDATQQVARHVDGDGLHGLVNLAGISVDGPVELLPLAALRRQFEVNVIGQVAVTQAFLPMLRATHGRIVNVGGAAGRLTLPMYGALSASKSALDSLTDALRMELQHQGIHVSYIEPGAVKTEFFRTSGTAAHLQSYAGNAESQKIYSRAIEASAKAMTESSAVPVDHAVRAIVRALTARHPAPRYIVGSQAKMGLRVLLHLPVGVRDRMLTTTIGLTKKSFDVIADVEQPRVGAG